MVDDKINMPYTATECTMDIESICVLSVHTNSC